MNQKERAKRYKKNLDNWLDSINNANTPPESERGGKRKTKRKRRKSRRRRNKSRRRKKTKHRRKLK